MQETRVNLKHLLEDIRDSYALVVEEAILTELVANSLDSKTSRIEFFIEPEKNQFTILDNGDGMKRQALKNYHNIAASAKIRGRGIGFAGIGAKLSLLIAKSVITETKGGYGSHCSTTWHLMNENRAPWKFISSQGKVKTSRGTAITIEFPDSLSPLLNSEFIIKNIKKHFYPLLHPIFFDSILKYVYKKEIEFFVNNKKIEIENPNLEETSKTFKITLGKGEKKLAGFGYLIKSDKNFSLENFGISISTYGKVIKQGWDWLGIFPRLSFQIHGLIEIPTLSEILTTNKNDFLKDGSSLKKYYRYRKAIQEAILPILSEFGEEIISFEKNLKKLKPLEKEIERMLGDVLENFPELTSLVGIKKSKKGTSLKLEGPLVSFIEKKTEETKKSEDINSSEKNKNRNSQNKEKKGKAPTLAIGFEENLSKISLARMIENTIWININHPAYQKAKQENLEPYHIFLSIAWTLSHFIEENHSPQEFISQFLISWSNNPTLTVKI
ncbi:MAG: ATP-binding protein [Candidatus Kuenenbacteria bacterium]